MFNKFAVAVRKQFDIMAKGELFLVDRARDDIWGKYLDSFPEGTNEIYLERREYDCNQCKMFLKRAGNIVAVKNGKLISVWDVEVEGYYKDVAKALSKYVKSAAIKDVFLHEETKIGAPVTSQLLDEENMKTKQWHHFSCEVPAKFVSNDVAAVKGSKKSLQGLFKRGLEEITIDACEIIEDLVIQNSLYRGEEHIVVVKNFKALKIAYDKLKTKTAKDIYTWQNLTKKGSGIRNSVIGTLLTDLSEGKGINEAVKSFETKVAPANYKRTSAPVTKGMIKSALAKIEELGLEPALHRRYAVITDISVNNVRFVDRSSAPLMKDSLESLLMGDVKVSKQNFDKVEEIGIEDFMTKILPEVTSMEVLFKNVNTPNLVSLIAPNSENTENLFKWKNQFSWSYSGNIADSGMKERVKSMGGKVDGVLRFSIQWNEEGKDKFNDLDAHCKLPGCHIYYSRKHDKNTGGSLDVDITRPNSKTAVENITWAKKDKMVDGEYKFYVNNYSGLNSKGFRAEIEMDGVIHTFNRQRGVTSDVKVATVILKNGVFSIKTDMDSTESTKEVWGIQTETFQKVSTIMLSPNHWDGEETGNRHHFFMLENCQNPDNARGIYNEFLRNDLNEHRKVFDLLADKMQCENSDEQLSGLGFSSTKRAELVCKVAGKFNRMLKIKF